MNGTCFRLLAAVSGALLLGGCVDSLPEAPATDGGLDADATAAPDGTSSMEAGAPDGPVSDAPAIDAPAAASFTFTVAPPRLNLIRGHSASIDVTVVPAMGFAGDVTLSATGLPSGVTASPLVIPSGTTSGKWTLQASSVAALTVDAQLSLSASATGVAAPPNVSVPLIVQDPPGTLDVTFGTNGVSVLPVYALNPTGGIEATAIQPDGKLVYCGNAPYQGSYYLLLGRLNADGSADPTFNPTGGPTPPGGDPVPPGMVVLLPNGTRTFVCSGLAVLPSGAIALSGFLNLNNQSHVMFVAQFTAAGAFDPNFGGGAGYVPLWTNNVDSKPFGFLVQSNGDLVVAGYVGTTPSITRLLPSGSPDTSFAAAMADGGAGFDTFASYAGSFGPMAALANGDWLVGLGTKLLAITSSTGMVDSKYGLSSGVLSAAPFDVNGDALAVESDGSAIYVGSTTTAPTSIKMVRFNGLGQLDTGFGMQGVATVALPGGSTSAGSIAAAADGTLVLGATLPGSASLGVIRTTATGGPDTTFAGVGYAGVPQADGSVTQSPPIVALDPAGRIVVTTLIEIPAGNADAGMYGNPAVQVARFWP